MAMSLRVAVVGHEFHAARTIQSVLEPLTRFPIQLARGLSRIVEPPDVLYVGPLAGLAGAKCDEELIDLLHKTWPGVFFAIGPVLSLCVERLAKRGGGHFAFSQLSAVSALVAWDAAVTHHMRQPLRVPFGTSSARLSI